MLGDRYTLKSRSPGRTGTSTSSRRRHRSGARRRTSRVSDRMASSSWCKRSRYLRRTLQEASCNPKAYLGRAPGVGLRRCDTRFKISSRTKGRVAPITRFRRQVLITQLAVEGFHIPVLPRTAGLPFGATPVRRASWRFRSFLRNPFGAYGGETILWHHGLPSAHCWAKTRMSLGARATHHHRPLAHPEDIEL